MRAGWMRASCAALVVGSLALVGCGDDSGSENAVEECITASNFDEAELQRAFQTWKDELVTSEGAGGYLRVVRPDTPDGLPNSTVSEGIAYGMLIAVYMDDQELFDQLWQYERLWIDPGTGLMNWYIDPTGTEACPERDSCGAATDADLDMAWALVMASARWGGQGTLEDSYENYARQQIELIYEHEVDHVLHRDSPDEEVREIAVLRPGPNWGGYDQTNISYMAPAYFRVFGEFTGKVDEWNALVDSTYGAIENALNETNGNQQNGLVPGWSDYLGTPLTDDGHFQYDAIRTPARVGLDYCLNGEPRAKAYLEKINGFFTSIGADDMVDGYELDGTPRPDDNSAEPQKSAVFVGCAGVGARSSAENQAFVDRAYERVAGLDLLTRSEYYQRSWTVLSMLMMGGKFVDLRQP